MVTIKRVESDADIESIVKLAHEIWPQHFIPIIGKAQVDYMLNKFQSKSAISEQMLDGVVYFKVCYQKELAGYYAVQARIVDKAMFISKLYLSNRYRGLGIAKVALRLIKQRARWYHLKTIYLTVNKYNTSTISFYKRMGFDVKEEVVTPIGNGFVMDDYMMEVEV